MVLFSFITTLIVSFVFFAKKNITYAMFTFMGLILFYILGIYKVLPEVVFTNIDIVNILKLLASIFLIISVKYVMDRYLVNEVGHDLADLIITIFPDRRLKLFVLFFVGQLAFSDFLMVNILLVYFIGKILKIDAILIMIIGIISLMVNQLFDTSIFLIGQGFAQSSDLLLATNLSNIFLVAVMILSFIGLFLSILFIKDDEDDDLLDIVKKDWKSYSIIITSYFILFGLLSLFFDANESQKYISVVMLGIISFVSTKLMRHNHEFMVSENKKYPFIFSIAIFVIDALVILFANKYIIIALLVFVFFNTFVLKYYKSFEEENVLDINQESKFIYKFVGIGVFYYVTLTLMTYSNINNSMLNTSIMESITNTFTTLNSPIEVFMFFFAAGPLFVFLPFQDLVTLTTSANLTVLVSYLFTVFGIVNIVIFYILHDLLGVEDNQALIGYHCVLVFSLLAGLILTLIVIIGG